MSYYKIIIAAVLLVFLTACANNQVRQVDPNYQAQLNLANSQTEANARVAEAAMYTCASDINPGLCVAFVTSNTSGGSNAMANQVPQLPRREPSVAERFLFRTMDIAVAALPIAGQVIMNRDNTDARVQMNESNNTMLSDIVTSGFDNMGAIGSVPNYSAGGNITIGDGNVGDGNTGIGDGFMIGDGNTGRDRITTTSTLGDGSVFGDGNQYSGRDRSEYGDENVIGDRNVGRDDTRSGRWSSDDIQNGDNRDNPDNSQNLPLEAPVDDEESTTSVTPPNDPLDDYCSFYGELTGVC